MSLPNIFSNPNFWAAISALASAASAIVALIIVWQTARSQAREIENRRAYIRVVIEVMEFTPEGAPSLPLKVSNIGGHSATKLTGKIVIANAADGSNPLVDREFITSNELVQGGLLEMKITADNPAPTETPPQLILFAIRYEDRVLNKTFLQTYYFEWVGVVGGTRSPTLTHCLKETKEVEACLGTYLKAFSTSKRS